MEKDLILEGNKLIAEFMGAVPEQWYPESKMYDLSGIHYAYPTSGIYPDNVRHHSDQLLKYDSDWSWLMPVVEKIARIGLTYLNVDEQYNPYPRTFAMPDEEGNMMVRFNCAPLFIEKKLIDATWKAVVDFIENQQTK
jgi:hypothetical protein